MWLWHILVPLTRASHSVEAQVHELLTNDEFVLSDVDDTELRVRMQPGKKFAAVETSVMPFLDAAPNAHSEISVACFDKSNAA